MIGSTRAVRVFAYTTPVDMRKSYSGLEGLVRTALGLFGMILCASGCMSEEDVERGSVGQRCTHHRKSGADILRDARRPVP